MKKHDISSCRQGFCHGAPAFRKHAPGRREVGVEKHGTSEAKHPQGVGKGIHARMVGQIGSLEQNTWTLGRDPNAPGPENS